jgi:hypothetical protein
MVRLVSILLSLAVLSSGCDSQAPSSLASGVSPATGEIPPVIIDPDAGFHSLLDETRTNKAAIDGDVLTLDLEFGGGCRDHDFQMISNGGFMESLPVQLRLFLRHDGNDDPCEALLHERVFFDLTPIAELYHRQYPGEEGPIILRITEAPDREIKLTYEVN